MNNELLSSFTLSHINNQLRIKHTENDAMDILQ